MSCFVTLDASGKPTGFYPFATAETAPAGAVEISDDLHADFAARQLTVHYDAASGTLVEDPPGPVVALIRLATTYQLMSALTDAQWTAYPGAKPKDQHLFSTRDTAWPEDNVKVARIATVLDTTPKAWFDAALGVAS